MAFTIFASLLALLHFLIFHTGHVNGSQGYLYIPGPDESETLEDVAPIMDYAKPAQLIGESTEDYEERITHPEFLTDETKPRVVEFYAPWCGHCIHYKPEYIKIAKQVNAVENVNLEFHAVSCEVHRPICASENVKGYPTIKWFPAFDPNATAESKAKAKAETDNDGVKTKGVRGAEHANSDRENKEKNIDDNNKAVVIKRGFKAEDLLRDYLHIDESTIAANLKSQTKEAKAEKEEESGANTKANTNATKTGIANANPPHVQLNIFHDARLSFEYAFQNSIFMTDDPLSTEQSKFLQSWLALVRDTMPVTLNTIKSDTKALLGNMHSIQQSEENLLQHMNLSGTNKDWSDNCSKHKKGTGYTCGLWELFHIMTIGVVQWNYYVSSDMDGDKHHGVHKISTSHAAESLKDYIENFFGCDECRTNFVQMYDNCQFERCNRLNKDVGGSEQSRTSLKQLPLWLWETHNDVNIRLMKEGRAEQGLKDPTLKEEQEARWPSKLDCPKCWLDGGGWEEEEVYVFLRGHYWPQGDWYDKDVGRSGNENGSFGGANGNHITRMEAADIVKPSLSSGISPVTNPFLAVSAVALSAVMIFFFYRNTRGNKLLGKCE